MSVTQALIFVMLVSASGFSQQKPTNFDKSMDHIKAGIEELKHDQAILEGVTTYPDVKICGAEGWPDTPECNLIARAAMKTIQEHYVRTPLTGGHDERR